MRYKLPSSSLAFALEVGFLRQEYNLMMGIHDAHGFVGNGLRLHQIGCVAELSVCEVLNIPWSGMYSENYQNLSGDVGGIIQVRSTEHKNGRLLLHRPPKDSPNKPFVLVRHQDELGDVEIVGWIYGHEGQLDRFWQCYVREPCYMIPDYFLRPVETCPR